MSIPDWISISPTEGAQGKTVVKVTVNKNMSTSTRGTQINFSCNNVIDTLYIRQKSAEVYILNISPSDALSSFGITYNPDAYICTVYKKTASGTIELSTISSLIRDIENEIVYDCLVNWSPFGGENICDYTFSINSTSINPSASSEIIATLKLNTIKDPSVSRPNLSTPQYINMWNAAFHQGSPVIEIAIGSDGKIFLYTLYQQSIDNYGDAIQLGIGYSQNSGNILSDISGVFLYKNSGTENWNNIMPANSGKYDFTGALIDGGITRIFTQGTGIGIIGGQMIYNRVLKWYPGDLSGDIGLFALQIDASYANKYSPEGNEVSATSVNLLNWYETGIPASNGIITMRNPDLFYNPTFANPFPII